MGNEFIYAQPVKIFFGEGRFQELGSVLEELKLSRCVIACGKHFAPTAQALMEKDERVCAVFGGVEQNPQLSGVVETARLAREHKADAVIGIGGGSAIDTAKFAAAIALGEGEALEYYRGERPFPAERLTIVAVSRHDTEKRTVNNPVFMPKVAIVDPVLSSTVPPRTTMNTGLDAMAHALEGYWSKNHQPISDLMAIEAVRLILENLERAWRDGGDKEARRNMAYASLLGGLSFALPKTAACHACSYPLSEDYHLPHGEACAFTLDSFVRLNADERLELLARRVGLKDTAELAERIRAFKALAGLRSRLSELGEVDLDKLCHDCAVHPLMNNNPVAIDEATLRAMFEALA